MSGIFGPTTRLSGYPNQPRVKVNNGRYCNKKPEREAKYIEEIIFVFDLSSEHICTRPKISEMDSMLRNCQQVELQLTACNLQHRGSKSMLHSTTLSRRASPLSPSNFDWAEERIFDTANGGRLSWEVQRSFGFRRLHMLQTGLRAKTTVCVACCSSYF